MSYLATCPSCESELKANFINFFSCKCGWHDQKAEKAVEENAEKRATKVFVVTAIGFIMMFMHTFTWGQHAFTIPFARVKQVTGMLGADGYKDLAAMCVSVGKYECAENAYDQQFALTKDPESLLNLANLQRRQKKVKEAIASYDRYFKAKGDNGDAMLNYARLLEQNKQDDEAVKYYMASIKARPQIVPVQATSGIVRIYMGQKKYGKAFERLNAFHRSSSTARDYLGDERQKLAALMRQNTLKRSIASH